MSPIEVSWPGLVDRLRAWSRSSWRPDRVGAVGTAAQQLVDLAAAASDEPVHLLPTLRPHALADQLVVVVADARVAGVDPDRVAAILAALSARLGFRLS